MRKFCTIDDLYDFCRTNNFTKFSSAEHGDKPLIVQSVESFEVSNNSKDGLLPVTLKACHIGVNRNQSSISREKMEKNMGSFKGRPILGAIHKAETGEWEFHSHDMQIVEDENGELDVEYIEQPVGVISELSEPYLEYDAEEDKTYLIASGNIFEDYSHAAEILQRRRTCKCSVEIAVEECSWNAKEEVLNLDEFSFRGVTILGYESDGVTEIQEGMKGSKITIDSFGENNSMFANNYQERLVETLDRLNETLSKFSINNNGQEGVETSLNHFEELLEKYGITVDDIEFEYEGLNDDELDALFEEHFGAQETIDEEFDEGEGTEGGAEEGEASEEGAEPEEGTEPEESVEPADPEEPEVTEEPEEGEVDVGGQVKKGQYVINENSMTVQYELSHDDIRWGIYELLDAEGAFGWIVECYNDKFIYCDYDSSCYFKRGYSIDGDVISLSDTKVQVYSQWLTQSEIDALEQMKKEYAQYKQFKEDADAAEMHAKKTAILDRDEFSALAEVKAFAELRDNIDNLTIEEVEARANSIADICNDFMGNVDFSAKSAHKSIGKIGMNYQAKANNKKQAYGGLFNK